MSEKVEVIYDMGGNQIAVGDTVICIARKKGYGELTTAEVVELHPKMVTLEFSERVRGYVWSEKLGKHVEAMVKERGTVRHNAVYYLSGVK